MKLANEVEQSCKDFVYPILDSGQSINIHETIHHIKTKHKLSWDIARGTCSYLDKRR